MYTLPFSRPDCPLGFMITCTLETKHTLLFRNNGCQVFHLRSWRSLRATRLALLPLCSCGSLPSRPLKHTTTHGSFCTGTSPPSAGSDHLPAQRVPAGPSNTLRSQESRHVIANVSPAISIGSHTYRPSIASRGRQRSAIKMNAPGLPSTRKT